MHIKKYSFHKIIKTKASTVCQAPWVQRKEPELGQRCKQETHPDLLAWTNDANVRNQNVGLNQCWVSWDWTQKSLEVCHSGTRGEGPRLKEERLPGFSPWLAHQASDFLGQTVEYLTHTIHYSLLVLRSPLSPSWALPTKSSQLVGSQETDPVSELSRGPTCRSI